MLKNIIKKSQVGLGTRYGVDKWPTYLSLHKLRNTRWTKKKFFQVPTVYNIKIQKEFQSYHMYSGSMKQKTRVYPLIEESLIHEVTTTISASSGNLHRATFGVKHSQQWLCNVQCHIFKLTYSFSIIVLLKQSESQASNLLYWDILISIRWHYALL